MHVLEGLMGQILPINLLSADEISPAAGAHGNARYSTSQPARYKGVVLTLLVYVLPAGIALFHWQSRSPALPPPSLATFDIAPPAAPPQPIREVPPGPVQAQSQQTPAQPDTPKLAISTVPMSTPPPAPAEQLFEVVKPAPPVENTTAPEARPAPPAPQLSSDKPTWEGQVLAALNKVKRYPREAQFRRRQGVPYIRFVIDREGRVLSSSLERGSGDRSLDAEAVSLPKRAQPLPRPPEERKGVTIELVVPVEFFLGT
ncbi:MAG: TonB family protein [Novosphingobium sp.]